MMSLNSKGKKQVISASICSFVNLSQSHVSPSFSSKQLTKPEEISKLEGHLDIPFFCTVNFFPSDTSLPPPACFDSEGHVEDTEGHPKGSEDREEGELDRDSLGTGRVPAATIASVGVCL